MPIHELGYRHWDGERRHRWARWTCISRTGVTLALRNKVVRRLSFLTIVPVLYFGLLFFAIGFLTDPGAERIGAWRGFASTIIDDERLLNSLRNNPASLRAPIWNDIFFFLMAYFQITGVLLITASVAPGLISRDIKSKAFLIYFSKPIARVDYLIGKAGVVFGYSLWFTLLPALLIYILSIAFAPSSDAFGQTAGVIPSIFCATLVVAIPVTSISLFLSSITRSERLATFAWIALVGGGFFIYRILAAVPGLREQTWIVFVSLPKLLWEALSNCFDDPVLPLTEPRAAGGALAFLFVVSALCIWGTWRNISAPMRI